jgi:hypothetical protein
MTNDQTKSSATSDLLPPDERFWQRYSPHHEALLAAVGSLTLHGLVFGIPALIALLGLGFWWATSADAQRPPIMTVVKMVGEEGDGAGGGEPAPLGQPGNEQETAVKPTAEATPTAQVDEKFPVVPSVPMTDVAEVVSEKAVDPVKDNVTSVLENIGKKAKNAEKPKVVTTAVRKGPRGVPNGQADGKGKGGAGGPGSGSGPRGVPMTKQQIFAQRWRFDMSGNGREHAAKLAAAGVILIIHDQFNNSGVVRDLKRLPVRPIPENLMPFKDAVQWTNNRQESLVGLATALQLRFVPIAVQILLPKEREEKMAEAEAAFARKQGRPFDRINETWFDFRLVNGAFEPVVIRQD